MPGQYEIVTRNEIDNYYSRDGSKMGIANCGPFSYPLHPESLQDRDAAEQWMIFQ